MKKKIKRSRAYQYKSAWEENQHRRVKLDSYSGNEEAVMLLKMMAAFHGYSMGMVIERIIQNRQIRCVFERCGDFHELPLKRSKFPKVWIHSDYLSWIKSEVHRHRLPSVSYLLNFAVYDHYHRYGYELNPLLNLSAPLFSK